MRVPNESKEEGVVGGVEARGKTTLLLRESTGMESELELVSLQNAGGLRLGCIRVGATVTSLQLPNESNVVLGFKDYKDYYTNSPYFGCIAGRVANRIKGSTFTLDDKEHHLTPNEPPNHLHGGAVGFNKVVWELKSHSSSEAVFGHTSPAGTEGYPGTLTSTVTYSLTEENEIHVTYVATTDAPTIVSLTNHSYFNLAGKGDILDHVLCIPSDKTTNLDGEVIPVTDKETDFRKPATIREKMTGAASNGFDCNYSLLAVEKTHSQHPSLRLCAILQDPVSGNGLEVYSDRPGIQLYTGNFLDGSLTGRDGEPLVKHSGVCLETQAWPNAVNIEGARDQMILRPGEQHTTKTIWKLSWK